MTTQTMVPFSKLVPVDAINARAATNDGLDELAASIAAKGLIQPIVVRPADSSDKYEVIDGRRRYQALAKLAKAKTIAKTYEVPVLVRNEDDAEALETSLAANTVRLPMHPVDQHTVFARLAAQGKSEAEIAARFGISERTVKQHLALGALAEPIREAWRKGKIDAKVAQAFTLAADPAVQTALYERLCKIKHYGPIQEWQVRSELRLERTPVQGCAELAFVGEDAYRAAGGTISDSLFEDERYVDDMPLLKKLAREKLEAECRRLVAEGWAWAEIRDDLGGAQYGMEDVADDWDSRDLDDPAVYTAEEKARSGCIVDIGFEGELGIEPGLVLSTEADGNADATGIEDDELDADAGAEDEDAAGDDAPSAAPEQPFAISGALSQSVSEALTIAVSWALASEPDLAMRAITAALRSRYDSPVAIRNDGHVVVRNQQHHSDSFAMSFQQMVALPIEDVRRAFAAAVGTTLDLTFQRSQYDAGHASGVELLRDALDPAGYLAAARSAFNAADYFQRASKAVALAALDEMHRAGAVAPLSPDLPSAKKSDIAELAATSAKACGWLPPELRHRDYALTPSTEAAE